jgi:hypothetical protein
MLKHEARQTTLGEHLFGTFLMTQIGDNHCDRLEFGGGEWVHRNLHWNVLSLDRP